MAYDFSKLTEKLKDQGLGLAEDAAEKAYEAVKNWILESAAESENKYDDLLLAVIPVLDEQVKKAIDKIDGEEG